VSDNLQTSREGIFAAGEITGIGGAVKSAIEGRLAALSLVEAAGIHGGTTRVRQIDALRRSRSHELIFARWLNSLTGCSEKQMRSHLAAMPDSTVVCRCEDIRMGDIRRAMERGYRSATAIKRATRLGMGCCQGSVCQTFLQDLLMVVPGASLDRPCPPSVRIPVRPVSLGVLARGLDEPLPTAPRDKTL